MSEMLEKYVAECAGLKLENIRLKHEIAELKQKCRMLEAEFESALDMAAKLCKAPSNSDARMIFEDFLNNTKFETTLANRDLEQKTKGATDLINDLFYAPSSPVSPSVAEKIKKWHPKLVESKLNKVKVK